MIGPLMPWEIIAPLVMTIAALFVVFNYLRTPVWMLVWIIIIGVSLYFLPGKLRVIGPAAVALIIFMVKKLGDVNS